MDKIELESLYDEVSDLLMLAITAKDLTTAAKQLSHCGRRDTTILSLREVLVKLSAQYSYLVDELDPEYVALDSEPRAPASL